jgi:hypothetical protein
MVCCPTKAWLTSPRNPGKLIRFTPLAETPTTLRTTGCNVHPKCPCVGSNKQKGIRSITPDYVDAELEVPGLL